MVLRVVGKLGEQPCRNEEQGEDLLGFIVKERPACDGGQSPEKNCCGPVFLDVEDLAYERDGCACRSCAYGVERGGEGSEGGARGGSGGVKHAHHGEGKQE